MDNKLYYTIGEVADMLQTSTSQLRYWSGEFELNVRKNRKGDRLFQIEDLEKLRTIQRMLKDEGFTIEGAKKKLKKEKLEPVIIVNKANEIIISLQKIKSNLELLKFDIDLKL